MSNVQSKLRSSTKKTGFKFLSGKRMATPPPSPRPSRSGSLCLSEWTSDSTILRTVDPVVSSSEDQGSIASERHERPPNGINTIAPQYMRVPSILEEGMNHEEIQQDDIQTPVSPDDDQATSGPTSGPVDPTYSGPMTIRLVTGRPLERSTTMKGFAYEERLPLAHLTSFPVFNTEDTSAQQIQGTPPALPPWPPLNIRRREARPRSVHEHEEATSGATSDPTSATFQTPGESYVRSTLNRLKSVFKIIKKKVKRT